MLGRCDINLYKYDAMNTLRSLHYHIFNTTPKITVIPWHARPLPLPYRTVPYRTVQYQYCAIMFRAS